MRTVAVCGRVWCSVRTGWDCGSDNDGENEDVNDGDVSECWWR